MFGKKISDQKFTQIQYYKQWDNDYCQDLIVTITSLSQINFNSDNKMYSIV